MHGTYRQDLHEGIINRHNENLPCILKCFVVNVARYVGFRA